MKGGKSMPQILKTEYVKGDTKRVFEWSDVQAYRKEGYLKVRTPRFETDPYIISRPSQVLVTYRYGMQEITIDKKIAIKNAYNKYRYGGKIKSFTEALYREFVKDLEDGTIEARWSKYGQDGNIYFTMR